MIKVSLPIPFFYLLGATVACQVRPGLSSRSRCCAESAWRLQPCRPRIVATPPDGFNPPRTRRRSPRQADGPVRRRKDGPSTDRGEELSLTRPCCEQVAPPLRQFKESSPAFPKSGSVRSHGHRLSRHGNAVESVGPGTRRADEGPGGEPRGDRQGGVSGPPQMRTYPRWFGRCAVTPTSRD